MSDFILSRKKPHQAIKSLFKLAFGILWADVSFSWFADAHALFAVIISRLFRRKSVVVVGGYEVAAVPEIGYGLMLHPRRARIVKYTLENADRVLTVDEGLKIGFLFVHPQ